MKFILLSDIHGTSSRPRARSDNVLLAVTRKLEYVFKYASSINAHILHAGDLSNSPRDILFLFKFISVRMKYPDVKFFTVYGQHDQYCRNKNAPSNLSILKKAGLVDVLSKDPYQNDNNLPIDLYGVGWNEKISQSKVYRKDNINILVIHASIYNQQLWKGHDYYHPKDFLFDYDLFDLILCGDIHRDFIAKNTDLKNVPSRIIMNSNIEKISSVRIICNTGPMLRLEATEFCMKHKPKFYVYNTKTRRIQTKIIPHAEASQVLSNRHLEVVENNDALGEIYLNSKQLEEVDIMRIIEKLIIESNKEEQLRKVLSKIV